MGASQAQGYADMIADGAINIQSAVQAHMASNLFPPPPNAMVDVALAAIDAVNDPDEGTENESEGGWLTRISLPEGVTYKGKTYATAQDIVGEFRLNAFIVN